MHTYRKVKTLDKEFFEVGHYVRREERVGNIMYAADEWVVLSQHDTEVGALCRVNFLNGGLGVRQ